VHARFAAADHTRHAPGGQAPLRFDFNLLRSFTQQSSFRSSWAYEHWPTLVSLILERERSPPLMAYEPGGPGDEGFLCHVDQRKGKGGQASYCTFFIAPVAR
jgi:hypothetical protein